MTRRNKVLIYTAGIIACFLHLSATGITFLFFLADMDGKFPIHEE